MIIYNPYQDFYKYTQNSTNQFNVLKSLGGRGGKVHWSPKTNLSIENQKYLKSLGYKLKR